MGFGLDRARSFLDRRRGAPAADQPGAKDTILVVVQLTGGNDGLNTVIPFKNDPTTSRPTIAIPKDPGEEAQRRSACTPRWTRSPSCWSSDSVCVVQGVGYPNPSQSHFRSMDI